MSLSWSFEIKRDKDKKVTEVDGKTSVGHSKVKAKVEADHIELAFDPPTLRMATANHIKELAQVLGDLQKELNE